MNETPVQLSMLGIERSKNRSVYILSFHRLNDLVGTFIPPSNRFVLLLLADYSEYPKYLGWIAKKVVDTGCAYFCAWGPGCELMHDAVDDASPLPDDDDSVLMTTGHADDSIEDAVLFALERTTPAGIYEANCDTVILAVEDRHGWPRDVEAAARTCLVQHAI